MVCRRTKVLWLFGFGFGFLGGISITSSMFDDDDPSYIIYTSMYN